MKRYLIFVTFTQFLIYLTFFQSIQNNPYTFDKMDTVDDDIN